MSDEDSSNGRLLSAPIDVCFTRNIGFLEYFRHGVDEIIQTPGKVVNQATQRL
jgi:hypothetical protein